MKLQVIPRFPAQLVGTAPITVTKANGIFTIGIGSSGVQFVTAAGTTTIATATRHLVFNKSAPSASPCNLPSLLLRDLVELYVWDFTGLAGDITLTPFGGEKIMGANTPWVIGSGGLPQTGGTALFTPIASLPGWVVR